MINANYVDGLELRIKELNKKLSDEADAALHLIAENKSLKAERDALAATAEALHKAYEASKFTEYGDKILEKAFATTPQQHLAERDAQKGRDGFIAGCLYSNEVYFNDAPFDINIGADQYADSIRQEKK